MYAIIETGGKQYKVQSGDVLYIEKLDVEDDTKITFDKIIAIKDDSNLVVGAPVVDGASVSATALHTKKGKKITVFTYRPKSGSKRKLGHRQLYTKVQIDAINTKASKTAAKTATKKVADTEDKKDKKANDKD